MFKTHTECVKPAKCFIVHKLSEWVYHTDGKRAFCLTCGDEAVARKTNDFTRMGTFEIISSTITCWLNVTWDKTEDSSINYE